MQTNYATPEALWQSVEADKQASWYKPAVAYWDKQEASYDGVLGGCVLVCLVSLRLAAACSVQHLRLMGDCMLFRAQRVCKRRVCGAVPDCSLRCRYGQLSEPDIAESEQLLLRAFGSQLEAARSQGTSLAALGERWLAV